MTPRFVIRRDPSGFTVADADTGEPVVIAMARQSGLSEVDARYTAEQLNRRAEPQAPTPAQ